MQNGYFYKRQMSTLDEGVRGCLIEGGVRAMVHGLFDLHMGPEGEVIVEDRNYLAFGIDPDKGVRAILRPGQEPTCQCEEFEFLGCCAHSITGWLFTQTHGKEGMKEGLAA